MSTRHSTARIKYKIVLIKQVAKQFYELGAFSRAVVCLQYYVCSRQLQPDPSLITTIDVILRRTVDWKASPRILPAESRREGTGPARV